MPAIRYNKHQQVARRWPVWRLLSWRPPFDTTNISKLHAAAFPEFALRRGPPFDTTNISKLHNVTGKTLNDGEVPPFDTTNISKLHLIITLERDRLTQNRHSIQQTSASCTLYGALKADRYVPPFDTTNISKLHSGLTWQQVMGIVRHSIQQTSASCTALFSPELSGAAAAIRYNKHQQVARIAIRARGNANIPPFDTTNISKLHGLFRFTRESYRSAIRYNKHQQVAQYGKGKWNKSQVRHSIQQTSASCTLYQGLSVGSICSAIRYNKHQQVALFDTQSL